MPTLKQKQTLKIVSDNVGISLGAAMRRAGYTKETSEQPHRLVRSRGWQELLAEIDDEPILARIRETATDKSDKRAMLQAADMLFKLKDRYPAQKQQWQGQIEAIEKYYVPKSE